MLAISSNVLDLTPKVKGPAWASRAMAFKRTISKVCPRCGAILPLYAKGCESCLLQFDIGDKNNVKRYGKRNTQTEQNT